MGALWLFTILLAPACTISPSQSPSPGIGPELTLTQQLQNKLDSTRELFEIKGVSAAVIMPNNKTWLGVSGMSDPTIEKRIVPEMLFDIGSIGKNYLATLILKLVEEGTLTLEDPLRNWISSYPNIDNNITIRQLLNHTSGIYDFVKHAHSPFQVTYKSTKIWSQEEILVELVDKPYFPPGKGWHYSTTNYVLLRMIAEKAMGSKVSPEIENRFLIPLSLNSTVAVDPLEAIPRDLLIANNWIGDFVDLATKPQPWTATSPDLIYATAEDAARWMHLLYHEKKVLNRKSLDQMLDF
jgi:D-alanyl-D-alanine carboxypeptidase